MWHKSRSLFSASFQAFCLTARAYLNTQKYGLIFSLTLLQLPKQQLQRSLSFLYHKRCISKTLTSTVLSFSSSRYSQRLAILKKQDFLGQKQLGPLQIVLMYFKFKIPVSMLSLCAMAVVSTTQHHQQHLHYLRPVDGRKRIKLQYLSNSMLLPWRTLTSTLLGM